MTYNKVQLNSSEVQYSYDEKGIWLLPEEELPDSAWIRIDYSCKPLKGIYFIGWQDTTYRSRRQIWTQGQGIDHRHWIPHHDDQTDKLIVKLSVEFADEYQVMANGQLSDTKRSEAGKTIWSYSMNKPMSSYLIAIAIGKFDSVQNQSASGVPTHQYFYSDRANDYDWYYRDNLKIFNYLENEIGIAYPWQNYKQAPVQDFKHGAMENTTATIFGDFFMVDSIAFNDENYTYVNAHELAHQWFGNLVTATGSDEHWLHEGFATYYQWLSERNLYGYDRADWDRYKAALLVFEASNTDEIPLGNGKAGSSRFYQKGAWVLHMLHHDLGDSLFKASIRHYLNTYAFGLVTTDSLANSILKITGSNYSDFFERWVHRSGEPILNIESRRVGDRIEFSITNLYRPAPDLPLKIPVLLQLEGGAIIKQLSIPAHDTILYLDLANDPLNYWVVNPNMSMLADIREKRDFEEWRKVYSLLTNLLDRHKVLLSLKEVPLREKSSFLRLIAADPAEHFALRSEALSQLISAQDKKALSLTKDALQDRDIHYQKEVVKHIPREWRTDLRKDLLPLLHAASYELRAAIIHLSVDVNNPRNNSWLYDDVIENQPGMPGNKVLIPALSYRAYLYQEEEALARLIDMCSPSFDFLTRINAIHALRNIRFTGEEYLMQLFNALFDLNWKLSSTAKAELQRIYSTENGREKIDKIIGEQRDVWQDFEKRRVKRTFESN